MQKTDYNLVSTKVLLRVFIKSFAALILAAVVMFNFKSAIQPYSIFSLARTMSKVEFDIFASNGFLYDIIFFIAVFIAIKLIWSFIITISVCKPFIQLNSTNQHDLYWLCILLLHLTFIIALNSYFYPTSLVSYFRGTFLVTPTVLIGLGFFLIFLFFRGALILFSNKTLVISSTITAAIITFPYINLPSNHFQTSKPNIIIVGIDGLRPDHLQAFTGKSDFTPFLSRKLAKTQLYKNSYTPQGRTYVAWMSILTGQYPINNGARFNLAPTEAINKNLPLIKQLKSAGYNTTFAIDERRFNQIDESYGLDNAVGPQIGAADAIISGIGDLPFINVLLNHPLSSYFFPYLYINRAYGKGYSPVDFNRSVTQPLSGSKPNFLAVHYCLLHWPYTSKSFISDPQSNWNGNYNHYMYKEMLKLLDLQIEDLFHKLKQQGALENAIVYFISDHGESFNQQHHAPIQAPAQKIPPTKSWGHGTNIFDQQQSHVLLAKAVYRDNAVISKPNHYPGNYSLIDIAPSIAQELNIAKSSLGDLDGVPLPTSLDDVDEERFVFIESSLPVRSINKSFIDKEELMSETASHYELRADGRAYMKLSSYNELIGKKQRAVYYKNWQLTMIPKDSQLFLYNRQTNEIFVANDYQGTFNWQPLLAALCQQYDKDLGFDKNKSCPDSFVHFENIVDK
ncbi:sulfatase-like hydrolase/transferase [Shewanella fidelis]|uniref:sulfatase-like hydrolase/transferase n=1 Tax=Shewanella fidelis TaxID=173509 RepID=UPI0004B48FEB|nr:sulfatase-like hydrolase/transferase [Shewanella fidelis]